MKLDTIYLKNNSKFSSKISEWAVDKNLLVEEYSEKNDESEKGIDGLVIFNQNQEVDREIIDIRAIFDGRQKPVHKIDINGTLMVGVSNLDLWLERNGCEKVLFIGSDSLVGNINLDRYLASLKTV